MLKLNLPTRVEDLIADGLLQVGDGYRAKNEELGKCGLPFARGGNIDGGFHFEGADRFPHENLRQVGSKVSQVGDVVFTSKGTVGRFAFVGPEVEQFVYSPQLCYWRSLNPQVIDPRWLYYWMHSNQFLEQARGVAGQTDMADYVSLRDQRRFWISVPNIKAQAKLAELLASLDDKIELNRRMNETLEAMARALFRSWFVDFDPVRAKSEGRPTGLPADLEALFPSEFEPSPLGEIPKGWGVTPVGQLCNVNSTSLSAKETLDDLEYIEISAVSRGDVLETTWYERSQAPGRARRRLRHGDTVLSTVRPDRGAYFLAYNPHAKLIASTGFAVFRPSSVPWSYVHCALTLDEVSDYLGRQADGGAYPAVSPEVIGRWEVVIPDDARILDDFHEAASALFDLAAQNRCEFQMLKRTRDELLPRLLSGEIEVAEGGVALHG